MILYSGKPLFDIVLTCVTGCIILDGTFRGKGQKKGEKKRQSMEKSVQNLVMFYHDESLQIPEEEKAFEQ